METVKEKKGKRKNIYFNSVSDKYLNEVSEFYKLNYSQTIFYALSLAYKEMEKERERLENKLK